MKVVGLENELEAFESEHYCPYPGCVCDDDQSKFKFYTTSKALYEHVMFAHGANGANVKEKVKKQRIQLLQHYQTENLV